ncbi:MAG: DNA repair protein RadA [Firmicutes bacterium]|nr:DNA repair protein RadA [Bacillota bacterium]
MAKKTRLIYYCENCGHQEHKWVGRCPACHEWGTLRDEPEEIITSEGLDSLSSFHNPQVLNQVKVDNSIRLSTGSLEFDRLLGGGIVTGSVLLLVGDPGIGKSTLSLITAGKIAEKGTVLYASGEESAEQTKIRADRLGVFPDSLYVIAEPNLELVKQHIETMQPVLAIIDSIQSVFLRLVRTPPGSPSQIKECALFLIKTAKNNKIPLILVGQVTKESQLAGPRALEHLVDTVVYLEGNRSHSLRVARVVKNRFGPTDEIALFEMTGSGILEVENPSEYLLEHRIQTLPGTVIVATGRGARPIFTEIQALVAGTAEGIPPRYTAIGVDRNRLLLVIAVLQRWMGEQLGNKNIFVSIAGGIECDDPALDLGIAVAIISSVRELKFSAKLFWIGELTLAGEVRPVPDLPKLLAEGSRLGFEECILAARAVAKQNTASGLKLTGIANLSELNRNLVSLGSKL